jgi:heptosyltransferase III
MTYGDYPDLHLVKKILVVKLRHHGDVLLTSPLFSNLKNALPWAEIDAFIYKDTLPMLEGHDGISHFLVYDRAIKKLPLFSRLFKELKLLKQIRKSKYDLVINLTEGDRGAIIAFVSASRYRVGFDPQHKGLKGKKRFYTHIVKQCSGPRHTVERQLDVLRRIGIFPTPKERDLSLFIPEEAKSKMLSILKAAGFEEGKYLILHAVSRWRFKCPPTSFMAELIQKLYERGEKVILSASPDAQEVAMVHEIINLAGQASILNLAGKTSLKELSALIKMSRCLICVDSVPLHIASALKVPVIALFGPSSEFNWGPWMHPQSRVVTEKISCRPCYLDGCGGSKMSDCLHSLSVHRILEAFEDLKNSFSPSCINLPEKAQSKIRVYSAPPQQIC